MKGKREVYTTEQLYEELRPRLTVSDAWLAQRHPGLLTAADALVDALQKKESYGGGVAQRAAHLAAYLTANDPMLADWLERKATSTTAAPAVAAGKAGAGGGGGGGGGEGGGAASPSGGEKSAASAEKGAATALEYLATTFAHLREQRTLVMGDKKDRLLKEVEGLRQLRGGPINVLRGARASETSVADMLAALKAADAEEPAAAAAQQQQQQASPQADAAGPGAGVNAGSGAAGGAAPMDAEGSASPQPPPQQQRPQPAAGPASPPPRPHSPGAQQQQQQQRPCSPGVSPGVSPSGRGRGSAAKAAAAAAAAESASAARKGALDNLTCIVWEDWKIPERLDLLLRAGDTVSVYVEVHCRDGPEDTRLAMRLSTFVALALCSQRLIGYAFHTTMSSGWSMADSANFMANICGKDMHVLEGERPLEQYPEAEGRTGTGEWVRFTMRRIEELRRHNNPSYTPRAMVRVREEVAARKARAAAAALEAAEAEAKAAVKAEAEARAAVEAKAKAVWEAQAQAAREAKAKAKAAAEAMAKAAAEAKARAAEVKPKVEAGWELCGAGVGVKAEGKVEIRPAKPPVVKAEPDADAMCIDLSPEVLAAAAAAAASTAQPCYGDVLLDSLDVGAALARQWAAPPMAPDPPQLQRGVQQQTQTQQQQPQVTAQQMAAATAAAAASVQQQHQVSPQQMAAVLLQLQQEEAALFEGARAQGCEQQAMAAALQHPQHRMLPPPRQHQQQQPLQGLQQQFSAPAQLHPHQPQHLHQPQLLQQRHSMPLLQAQYFPQHPQPYAAAAPVPMPPYLQEPFYAAQL
ncbi:hypothetical protein TSOC_011790 [Tetrabaena socialis]|uniref:Uncharacterized protein n=1 Tax=Tetrabaena socialis TaxID=47790 RepID=A0A2J7ZPS1_9CHLO|nr:hypothetical protein TSOC_011790 [Tetrabaena socialis]|eukprot:PNH02268.1 hypothetical protein TSOC_011790 [Tetrabaena socialis]